MAITNEQMRQAIRRRGGLDRYRICLKRFMSIYDMDAYTNIVRERIQTQGLLDGEHIQLCLDDGAVDLLLDDVGLSSAREILGGYIDTAELDTDIEWLKRENDMISSVNAQLAILRTVRTAELREIMKNPQKYFKDSTVEKMVFLLTEELRARSMVGRLRAWWLNACTKVGVYARLAFKA